jgi:RNA polymerase sigma factor (sigma-70 family)
VPGGWGPGTHQGGTPRPGVGVGCAGHDRPSCNARGVAGHCGAMRGAGRQQEAARARLEALYVAHARRVLAFAVRRTTQPADAADVLAEVFLVAWRRIDDVPPGDEACLWLYGVAHRVLANGRRADRRRRRLGARLAAALTEHVVADPTEHVGAVSAVRVAMASLSPEDRDVLRLAGWEGLSAPEIGVVLGLSPVAVRSRVHRARARLRAALAAGHPGRQQPGPGGHEDADERPLVRDHEDQP